MLGLAVQMLRFRKGGFAATFIALAAGVMVLTVCGLLVESGLRYQGQSQRYAEAAAVVAQRDLTIAGPKMFGEQESTTLVLPEPGTVPAALVQRIAALPGVAGAVGDRSLPVVAMAAANTPATGHGWGSAALAPYRVVSGAPPRADGEIAVDGRLAAAGRLRPGATAEILVGGTAQRFRVSGVVEAPGPHGGKAALFFTDTRAALLDPRPGRVDAIGVLAEPGADRSEVAASVRRAVTGTGAKTYTGDELGLAEDPAATAARELVTQAGGAFGGYAALIIGFVVAATVGLSVRYRRRDLALLRAIAATPGQVRLLILGEAGMLSLLAAVVGVPAGIAATAWIRGELVTRGFIPDTFALRAGVLAAPAVVVAVAAVALVSAWIAARRATGIRPTEALGEAAVEASLGGRVRAVSGLVLLAVAVCLIALTGGLDGEAALGAAVSMLYTFVLAIALLAPWINMAAARLLAPVLRTVWRDSGYLAAANLRANARGMVAVLTALVLSVGFGGTVWFLQDNLERETVDQSRAGILAQHALVGAAGLPASAADEARRIPGVVAATGVRRTSVIVPMAFEGMAVVAQGIDPRGAEQTMDLRVLSGRLADLDGTSIAVSESRAQSSGWKLGENARLWLGDGTPVTLRVVAIYDRGLGFGDVTLSNETLAGHTATGRDDHVLIRTAPGADTTAALTSLAGRYPASAVTGTDRFTGELARDLAISAWLNKLLIAVLVGYAVLAAANTLVMAALSRRRELSLLRLVGVTRGQVRRMVYAEQSALLGVALSIGVAIAAVTLSSIVNAVAGRPIPYVPAAGWIIIVGGTAALALAATILPIGRVLRTRPVEGIGIRE
ncbi:ABC transporter permease [Actinomadura craniellae]|uniref:ABC transporter permease n=1 Tax=Actinomadura craniellae TaxID=2231787 RepID=A0A365H6H4_9ACTN|nr:FtsX-like permease family protein [Actinomadura craniellae]RAY14628.1 ABC transporter permease [Actinomadura craniellae]